jgi:hypothetical protein
VTVDQETQPAYLEPYARAVRKHGGADFRALLWASRRTQEQRFDALLRLANPAGLRVLDLGCGCGDLLDFLIRRGVQPRSYVGIEGVAELAEAAKCKRPAGAEIVVADFVADPSCLNVDADIVYCSGALNTIAGDDFYHAIADAFATSRRAFVFNFLSSPLLAGATYLFWHRRLDVLRFARSLRASVQVIEDYIEGDCTIALRKAWAA